MAFELLAPAGNFPMLVAAVNAGADAVYFGLQEFTMRQGARNFQLKDLKKVKKICDEKNVKKYMTLNSIIYEGEQKRLEEIIKKSKPYVDAIICWDHAVMRLCKKHKVPFIVSTQASVSNSESAKFYKEMGAIRIVPARELKLKQIKELSKVIEIETFAHGAMCLSISGRCLMSQFLFKKSANRGECLQPCRRAYTVTDDEGNQMKVENSRVLSPKDLCTLPFIEEMKKAGITGFKIEGRNRDARYVDIVVRAYRKALDQKLTKEETEELMRELEKVFNREFSSGFYYGLPTSDDYAKIENSAATEKKRFVGKVTKYYKNLGVAIIKVSSEIKLNDKICVIGNETGIIHEEVKSMEKNKQKISQSEKGDEIAIKLPLVKKQDEVYVIEKR